MALPPTLFAVGQPVLEVEGRVGEDLAAVGAHEALGVERPAHRLQAVLKKNERYHFETKIIASLLKIHSLWLIWDRLYRVAT